MKVGRPGYWPVMEIIFVIIVGALIGLLGKFVAPGDKDNIPIWLTILCGIGGVILGWFVYRAFGGNGSAGVDWVRWFVAIAVAVNWAARRAVARFAARQLRRRVARLRRRPVAPAGRLTPVTSGVVTFGLPKRRRRLSSVMSLSMNPGSR